MRWEGEGDEGEGGRCMSYLVPSSGESGARKEPMSSAHKRRQNCTLA